MVCRRLERGRGWTDPYVFASSGQPGITHYQAVRDDAGETVAVIGIDVRLNELSEFLADRSPSEGGQALIIADDGSVIAGPANSAFTPSELEQLAKQSMGLENGAAVVSEWTLHGELHVAAVARIGGDDQWTLAVLAPEDDFLQGISPRPIAFEYSSPSLVSWFSSV